MLKNNLTNESNSPWKVKATQELIKFPQLKVENLNEIRQWLLTKKELPESSISDEMILHFLFACDYDISKAETAMHYFYTYKSSMHDFFTNWDITDPSLRKMSELLFIGALPQHDPEGYNVIITSLRDSNPKHFHCALSIKLILMHLMSSIWNNGIQKGYIIVYDANCFSFSHCFKCSLTALKNYIDFGKNATPTKVIRVVVINTSGVIDKLFALIKPFLNKDLINMISFHTTSDSYFKDLPKENVPEDYGGEAPPLVHLHRELLEKLENNRDWLLVEEAIKIEKQSK